MFELLFNECNNGSADLYSDFIVCYSVGFFHEYQGTKLGVVVEYPEFLKVFIEFYV